jgi:hypothetical protein
VDNGNCAPEDYCKVKKLLAVLLSNVNFSLNSLPIHDE